VIVEPIDAFAEIRFAGDGVAAVDALGFVPGPTALRPSATARGAPCSEPLNAADLRMRPGVVSRIGAEWFDSPIAQ